MAVGIDHVFLLRVYGPRPGQGLKTNEEQGQYAAILTEQA